MDYVVFVEFDHARLAKVVHDNHAFQHCISHHSISPALAPSNHNNATEKHQVKLFSFGFWFSLRLLLPRSHSMFHLAPRL
jgi:hypothetical protein